MITERIDTITGIPPNYRHPIPPIPRSVKIELTARCDLACFFCATSFKLRKKGDIDFTFLVHILSEMRKLGVEEIGLFYLGESFLYPKLVDAIYWAKELEYPYIFLTTNGRKATYDRVRQCVEAGLDSLKFSLNAMDTQSYKEITHVDAFKTVIQNIKDARRAIQDSNKKCGLYVSSFLYDHDSPTKMQRVLDEISPFIDEHYWLPLYGQAGFTANSKSVAGNIGRMGALRDSLPCWAIFTEGHITYDGFLSACCFDHDGRFHMGDLNKTSFKEAWECADFQTLRQHHLEKNVTGTVCEKCIAYEN